MTGMRPLPRDDWDDGELATFAASVTRTLQLEDEAPARASATRAAALGAFAAASAAGGVRPQAAATTRAPATPGGVGPRWHLPAGWSRPAVRLALPTTMARRAAMIGATAAVALAVTAGAAAWSGPGGALYPLRLAIEAAGLPGDPASRDVAEVSRLDARVGEVQAAAAREDEGAMIAGLDAFAQIADETAASAVRDPAAAEQLGVLVARLEELTVPPDTAAARDAAIAAGRRLILALSAGPGPSGWPPGGPASPSPAATAGPSPSPASSSDPGPTAGGNGHGPGPGDGSPQGTAGPSATATAAGGPSGTGLGPGPNQGASPAASPSASGAGGSGGGPHSGSPNGSGAPAGGASASGNPVGWGSSVGSGSPSGGSGGPLSGQP